MKLKHTILALVCVVSGSSQPSVIVQKGAAAKTVKWQGPKRLIQVGQFDFKVTRITNGSGGSSFSASFNNAGGSASATGPATLEIGDPQLYSSGVGDMATTVFSQYAGFEILDPDQAPANGNGAADASPAGVTPEFVLKATVTDLTVKAKAGGIRIGSIGGGKQSFTNRVVLDMRLVDPESKIVIASCKAVGEKSSETNTMALIANDGFGGERPVAEFGKFAESPLGDATRVALENGVQKLAEELMKQGWTCKVIDVREANGKQVAFIEIVDGVKVGDKLEAIIPGQVISDQKTGRRLGTTKPTILGQVQVVAVNKTLVEVIGSGDFVPEVGTVLRPITP